MHGSRRRLAAIGALTCGTDYPVFVILAGLLGPIVAGRRSWNIPVVVGELLAGVEIGASGFELADPAEHYVIR
ncbi:hypothetical protein IV500_03260 [Paeniglutamicibacter antarcticus]|uniref:Uncharacterized protein n=1 Tax=Arthrobacter terrae TaxID=2935737 RepID=A0A931G3A5_9MICC|nr:hypothetical protein [Arthrobacter terrae]MBG0738446.1 hypothetical protein [Arthrobacter terrae]